jgi:hypothetical protein
MSFLSHVDEFRTRVGDMDGSETPTHQLIVQALTKTALYAINYGYTTLLVLEACPATELINAIA